MGIIVIHTGVLFLNQPNLSFLGPFFQAHLRRSGSNLRKLKIKPDLFNTLNTFMKLRKLPKYRRSMMYRDSGEITFLGTLAELRQVRIEWIRLLH